MRGAQLLAQQVDDAAPLAVGVGDDQDALAVMAIFCVLCIIPMAIPVVLLLATGSHAEVPLRRLRGWIVKNNGVIGAGFLAIVAFTQVQKAIQAWV